MAVKKTLSAVTSSASLQHRRQVSELSVRRGTIEPNVVDVANLYKETAASPTIRASRRPPIALRKSLISMATKANCCIAATRLSNWRRTRTSLP